MRRYPCESLLDYKEEGYAMEIDLPCSNEMNFGASGESYFESFSFSDGIRWRNLHQQWRKKVSIHRLWPPSASKKTSYALKSGIRSFNGRGI
jgi:hypothetical protein